MRNVARKTGNPQTENAQERHDTVEASGNFKYNDILRQISALGWSTDLQQLPELNLIQLWYVFDLFTSLMILVRLSQTLTVLI